MEKLLKSKYYSIVVAFVIFAFWFMCYMQYSKADHMPSNYLVTFETIGLIVIGIVSAYLLIRHDDMFYAVPWIVYTPFVFSRPFDTQTIPYSLFIAGGLFFIGLVCHLIRFRKKLKMGSFFAGIALIGVSLVLGGINTNAPFLKEQIIFTSIAGVGLILIYVIFASNVRTSFRRTCRMLNNLGVLLCIQVMVSINHSADPLSFLITKNITVGWGSSNNIAMMLLLTFPCGTYLAIRSKGPKIVLYVFSVFVQMCIIIITYSRGAIAALIIGASILFVITSILVFKQERSSSITYVASVAGFTILIGIGVILFINTKNEYLLPYANGFKENITHINLTNFNGRNPIYENCIAKFKENMLFGQGLYAPFYDNDVTGGYQWGHSTVIHTMYTMGIVGLVALGIHFAQKYLNLLIKPNLEKITACVCMFASGLYGLVDVSYYFINYMVVLIMMLVCLERTIRLSFDIEE